MADKQCAGFIGSVYQDCINKPCYLCKQPGHTTATCPHRIAPESVNMPPADSGKESLFAGLGRRLLDGRHATFDQWLRRSQREDCKE